MKMHYDVANCKHPRIQDEMHALLASSTLAHAEKVHYRVCKKKKGIRYEVPIHKWKGRTIHRGKTFDTPEEAHKYYLECLEIRQADAQKEFEELIKKAGQ